MCMFAIKDAAGRMQSLLHSYNYIKIISNTKRKKNHSQILSSKCFARGTKKTMVIPHPNPSGCAYLLTMILLNSV